MTWESFDPENPPRGGLDYSIYKGNYNSPRIGTFSVPSTEMTTNAQRQTVPAAPSIYRWDGPQPYGMKSMGDAPNSSVWEPSVPTWAKTAYEHARASTYPNPTRGRTEYTQGFAPPPQGYQSPTATGSNLLFHKGFTNFMDGSGIKNPDGKWDYGMIDYSKPNWWNPQSGAWHYGKEEKGSDMGGLGMLTSLGGALLGFGFSPPIMSMMQGGGGGINSSLQATMGNAPQQQTPVSAVSNQLMQQSAASRAATAQQRAQQRASTQRGLFNLGAISNYRR